MARRLPRIELLNFTSAWPCCRSCARHKRAVWFGSFADNAAVTVPLIELHIRAAMGSMLPNVNPLRGALPQLTLLMVLMAMVASCSETPFTPPTGSPRITVIFPNDTAYDRNGNGLLDLEVSFVDSPARIDFSTIGVTSNRGATAGANLFSEWTILQVDSAGFRIEETLDHLLPRGTVQLTISLEDVEGDRATKVITVSGLPPAHFYKFIDLEADHSFATSDITVIPERSAAYVTTEEFGGTALSIVDLQSLALRRTVRTQSRALSRTTLDPDRQRLYLMSLEDPEIGVFDLVSETFLQPIPVTSRGIGIALSRRRSELYVALAVEGESNGFISVVDIARSIETRIIDLHIENLANPGLQLGMARLAINQEENRLYAPTDLFAQQGVLAVDPISGTLVDHFDLWPEHSVFFGSANDVDLFGNSLIATSGSENGLGRIAVIPLDSPLNLRFGPTGQFLIPKNLEVAPDRSEWGITLAGLGHGFHAVQLMDPLTLRVNWEYPIPLNAISPEDIAFLPGGHLFLVAGGRDQLLPAPSPSELYVFLRRSP